MYSIYHIPSVKIGVSINPKVRVKKQGYSDYEILEEHTDVYEVSIREQQLQRQYGYKVDTKPYWKTIKMSTFQSCSKGGKIGIKAITKEIRSKTHKHNIESGHMNRMSNLVKKPILQYDLNGKFIKEWESGAIAARELGLHKQNITKVCKGTQNHTGGFTFKYKK